VKFKLNFHRFFERKFLSEKKAINEDFKKWSITGKNDEYKVLLAINMKRSAIH
jgi:hypothetical protein